MRFPVVFLAGSLSLLSLIAGCEENKPEGPAPSRFAAVKREASSKAASTFCEKQWPVGEGGKKYVEPPERPVPLLSLGDRPGAWKWVNLWATWCQPCVEEMGLLARWKDSLAKDGVALNLELWSVDDDEEKLNAWLEKSRSKIPGRLRWLRSLDDLGPTLESLGADKASAIPIHALIDGNGNLRCLRVGSVHDEDYGAIKTILTGS